MIQSIRSFPVCTCLSVAMLAGSVGPAVAQTVNLAPASSTPGVKNVIADTVTDFTWLTVGLAAASIVHSLDGSMTRTLSGSSGADRFFGPGATIGGARFQLVGALATYGVGRLTGHARVADFGADLVSANIVAQALTSGIKLSVRRGRPDGTEFSFPSGHTSVSFAAATVVQRHFGWSAGVPAYAVASYVAASRIQDKRHYLSDVAMGAVVGIVAGRAVTVGHGNHRFAVQPMVPDSGGVGIAFVKK
jgi:membrane-associated phospholipid phosphatase